MWDVVLVLLGESFWGCIGFSEQVRGVIGPEGFFRGLRVV